MSHQTRPATKVEREIVERFVSGSPTPADMRSVYGRESSAWIANALAQSFPEIYRLNSQKAVDMDLLGGERSAPSDEATIDEPQKGTVTLEQLKAGVEVVMKEEELRQRLVFYESGLFTGSLK